MAKHDQTILKFLNQHADRSPTLIDMMTKLKINVSDITDSLTDLLAKGVISKQTNEQGMEIWSVVAPGKEAKPPEMQIPAPSVAPLTLTLANLAPTTLSTTPAIKQAEPEVKTEIKPTVSPEALAESPKSEIPKSEIPKLEIPKPEIPAAPAAQLGQAEQVEQAALGAQGFEQSQPSAIPMQPAPFYPMATPQGIGRAGLVFGLLVMGALAIGANHWLGQKRIEEATKDFVDQKSFTDFGNSYLEFEERAKSEVSALKTQVKSLQDQIASQQALVDSLKTTLAVAAAEAEKAAAKNKKGKVVKRR